MVLKLKKYCNAGVREYWLVDPKKKLLYMYDFEHGKEDVYSLDGKLGLAIYQGEIFIDLGKFEKFFLEREIQRSRKTVRFSTEDGQEVMKVEEDSLSYLSKQQGGYTVEDFFRLPYDRWAELIDGTFYEMEKPYGEHEELAVDILTQIYPQVKVYGDGVFTFRTCLQLDCNDKTMMLPDFMILCDKKKWNNRVIYGAPDFVLEILSPSTRKKDLNLKHRKYLNAGVREYWIVDPKEKRLITYDFENGENVASYPFTEVVGLSIYDKQIIVDLNELAEIIEG
ncbi:MAG: Uma2 family endonuclease [Lachnospiraceae bacterium]|nr:Uma2 family endonuclease [Lachnospiraceae bacterium]